MSKSEASMTAAAAAGKRAVLWFRRGLRLHDNPALLEAIRGAEHVTPVFVLNSREHSPARFGRAKMNFLLESLTALDAALRERDSALVVLRGDGNEREVLLESMARWKTSMLCFENAPEPHLHAIDNDVDSRAAATGVTVVRYDSHLVWDHGVLEELSEGRTITQYNSFLKLLERAGPPERAEEDAPAVLPRVCGEALADDSGIPTLRSLGFDDDSDERVGGTSSATTESASAVREVNVVPGGEAAALARLREELSREQYICEFEKPKTSPTALVPSTTLLSPYIAWGCLSSKRFYHGVLDVYTRNRNKTSSPPTSLEGQILWREFYYFNGRTVPNYDRMVGNPICKQIPWTRDEATLAAWKEARTGYPWIDAAMTQLRTQGWIHHLARHAVACFLTRGDLWVHWELGRDVFDQLLLDADWSLNNGNWMWLSASAFFHQFFRVYGPVSFPKKYDPEGSYVRHFVPALKNMPKKYIYEPWTAPADVQREAKCIIGVDYPRPIVVHGEISKELIGRMAAAYSANKGMKAKPVNVADATVTRMPKRART